MAFCTIPPIIIVLVLRTSVKHNDSTIFRIKIAVGEAQAPLVFQEALVLLTEQMFSNQSHPLVNCVANIPVLSQFFSPTFSSWLNTFCLLNEGTI